MAISKPDIPTPPPAGKPGGLGEKIENTLKRVVAYIVDTLHDALRAVIAGGLELLLEAIEQSLAPKMAPVIDDVLATDELPPGVRQWLEDLKNPSAQAEALGLGSIAMQIGMSASSALLAPLMRLVNYRIDRSTHTARPDPPAAFAMWLRGGLVYEEVVDKLRDLGWSRDDIEAWFKILRPTLNESDLLDAYFRELISHDELDRRLFELGWSDDNRALLQELYKRIPGPGDLISMAVREAFDDEQAERLGLDLAFPAEFAEWMRRQGYDEAWSRRYWRAHWQLPSAQMGFEMLHRGVIDEDDLRALLRALDISPVWHERLMQIAYNLPTRVDTRRMYELGVIDRDEVKRIYKQLGYDERFAELMTQWTEKEYDPEDRQLAKTDILNGYRDGLLSYSEALAMLRGIGYNEEFAEFYLARVDYERAKKQEEEILKVIEQRFKRSLITEQEAREQMSALGLPARQIDINIELWRPSAKSETRTLSLTQLSQLYLDHIISADQLREELLAAGYNARHVAWYIRALDQRAQEEAAKLAERAQEEAARAEKAKTQREYQRKRAELDLQIALQRKIIADAQAALNAALTSDEVRAIEEQIDNIDAQIAALNSDIAKASERRTQIKTELDSYLSAEARQELEDLERQVDLEVAKLKSVDASLATEINELNEMLLVETDAERRLAIKQRIAQLNTQRAQAKELIEQMHVLLAEARNELRARIPDAIRQRLEREDADLQNRIAADRSEIVALKEQRTLLQQQLSATLSDAEKRALLDKINEARREIARLTYEKAKLKVEEV